MLIGAKIGFPKAQPYMSYRGLCFWWILPTSFMHHIQAIFTITKRRFHLSSFSFGSLYFSFANQWINIVYCLCARVSKVKSCQPWSIITHTTRLFPLYALISTTTTWIITTHHPLTRRIFCSLWLHWFKNFVIFEPCYRCLKRLSLSRF